MNWYKADLHVHSVLSPCGDLEMSPDNVLQTAFSRGVDIIAITDHNSFANNPAFRKIARRYGISYIFGAEIQTAEEVHLITLFDDWEKAEAFGKELYTVLPDVKNDPEYFGDQVIIDDQENILGFEEKALINSLFWSIDECVAKVNEYGGFCFPAHVDAATFSIIGQLGFIPPESGFSAVGITAKCNVKDLLLKYPYLKNYSLFRNSDAHYLQDIASGYTEFYLEAPTLSEIRKAVVKADGRYLLSDF